MQPDDEADDLHALLHEQYGAPRLDDQFSADLVGRLQAEAAPSSTPTRPRRPPLAICLGAAAIAALVIAVLWIANRVAPGTNHQVAHRAKTDSDPSALAPSASPVESTEIEESEESDRLDTMSLTSESEFYSESYSEGQVAIRESEPQGVTRENEPQGVPGESEVARESLGQTREPSQYTTLSVIPNHYRRRWNVSAMVAHADMLYVVDSGQLYEVSPIDGSRRIVGDDDWQNTAAMGAAGAHLYIVSDRQLYEVSPATGARRSLGKPDWAETEAVVTVGDKLYIVAGGLLHRVAPSDGSREVLHNKDDGTNDPRRSRH